MSPPEPRTPGDNTDMGWASPHETLALYQTVSLVFVLGLAVLGRLVFRVRQRWRAERNTIEGR